MKLRSRILIFIVLLFSMEVLKSQSTNNTSSVLPLKSANSVLFGKDIIIDDNPSRDQRQVSLCSAFNGWLYAMYTFRNSYQSFPGYTILKSVDNGITWTILIDDYVPMGVFLNSSDIVVTGDSVSNLKLFLVYVISSDESLGYGNLAWLRYNAESGVFEDGSLLNDWGYYISVGSDFMYHATNSNPYSIGIVYSKYTSNGDSIIIISSSNGGFTFDNRKVIAGTGKHFHKVALTYGRSLSQNTGRYYAAWEEKADFTSTMGHIYTAHSEPYFNSSWTTPVMLDSLNSSLYNNLKNPSIACQYNNINNDSSNFTEVVLFDTYNSATSKYDINGFYNMRPTNTDHFNLFTPNLADGDNRQEASINFNPFDSTFMLTFYDATNQKLPFLTHNFNMINADSWQVVNSGYNDSSNLANPYPRVALNFSEQKGMNVWAAEGTGGNGIAMFDAPYSTYTVISETNKTARTRFFGTYPNPGNNFVNIGFELKRTEKVMISLYDLFGQFLVILADNYFNSGIHELKIDISKFPSGTFIYRFQTSDYATSGKLVIVK